MTASKAIPHYSEYVISDLQCNLSLTLINVGVEASNMLPYWPEHMQLFLNEWNYIYSKLAIFVWLYSWENSSPFKRNEQKNGGIILETSLGENTTQV